MRTTLACVFAAALCLASTAASAHALNVFVHEEGGSFKGSAYFTGGIPAKNAKVSVTNAAGQVIEEIQTDSEGNFRYTGARVTGGTVFVVSTPDGHRAEARVGVTDPAGSVQSNSASANPGKNSSAAEAAPATSSERQLGAIQEAIDRLEHHLWLRDVIGGIGYIFGLAGFWALWKSRQRGGGH